MLDSFRHASRHWSIKVMFTLLIGSFVVWGFGDMLRLRIASQPAVKVGRAEFSGPEVEAEIRRAFDRLQGRMTREQARAMGLEDQVIRQMVNRALLDQAAAKLELTIDDETLRQTIAAMPAFRNQLNVFDKDLYQNRLRQAGYNEQQFVASERGDLRRERLAEMVQGGVRAPAPLAGQLFSWLAERRSVQLLPVSVDQQPLPPAPGGDVLTGWYQAHGDLFKTPELRAATVLELKEADLSAGYKPDPAQLDKLYQARKSEFAQSEKRVLTQAIFSDDAKAAAAAAAVAAGKSFADAVKAQGSTLLELGKVSPQDVPLPALAEAAFALPAPGLAGPVKSPLGVHLVQVSAIEAGKARPEADVRAELVAALAHDDAARRLYDLVTKLEDSLGAGAPLEEAAQAVGVTLRKIPALDAKGRDDHGKPLAGLSADVVTTVFATGKGSRSDVVQSKDHSTAFVVQTEAVTESTLRPYDDVKGLVLFGWQKEQQLATARQQAKTAADKLSQSPALALTPALVPGGQPLQALGPFYRQGGQEPLLTPALAEAVFALNKTGAATVVDGPSGPLLVRLTEIFPADSKSQPAGLEQIRQRLTQDISNDLMDQFLASLAKDYGVSVNRSRIDQQAEK